MDPNRQIEYVGSTNNGNNDERRHSSGGSSSRAPLYISRSSSSGGIGSGAAGGGNSNSGISNRNTHSMEDIHSSTHGFYHPGAVPQPPSHHQPTAHSRDSRALMNSGPNKISTRRPSSIEPLQHYASRIDPDDMKHVVRDDHRMLPHSQQPHPLHLPHGGMYAGAGSRSSNALNTTSTTTTTATSGYWQHQQHREHQKQSAHVYPPEHHPEHHQLRHHSSSQPMLSKSDLDINVTIKTSRTLETTNYGYKRTTASHPTLAVGPGSEPPPPTHMQHNSHPHAAPPHHQSARQHPVPLQPSPPQPPPPPPLPQAHHSNSYSPQPSRAIRSSSSSSRYYEEKYITKQQELVTVREKVVTYSSLPHAPPMQLPPMGSSGGGNYYEVEHRHQLERSVKPLPTLPPPPLMVDQPPAPPQHVINPSNLLASKEQHPSPNYARKCPQIYATTTTTTTSSSSSTSLVPEEHSASHHHHLYMSTPQFSSEKFTSIKQQHHAQQQHQQHLQHAGNKYMRTPTPQQQIDFQPQPQSQHQSRRQERTPPVHGMPSRNNSPLPLSPASAYVPSPPIGHSGSKYSSSPHHPYQHHQQHNHEQRSASASNISSSSAYHQQHRSLINQSPHSHPHTPSPSPSSAGTQSSIRNSVNFYPPPPSAGTGMPKLVINTPEMSPIIMKQSHHHHHQQQQLHQQSAAAASSTHYQYSSKSPLPPSATAAATPPHIHTSHPVVPAKHYHHQQQQHHHHQNNHQQRSTDKSLDYDDGYEPLSLQVAPSPLQHNSHHQMFVNPYITPPSSDSCCKDMPPYAPPSAKSSSGPSAVYHRDESPHSAYPGSKYVLKSAHDSPKYHPHPASSSSPYGGNHQTPPPAGLLQSPYPASGSSSSNVIRAPPSQSFYSDSKAGFMPPSPAAATVASPSPSAIGAANTQHHLDAYTPTPPPPNSHQHLHQSHPHHHSQHHRSASVSSSSRMIDLTVGYEQHRSQSSKIQTTHASPSNSLASQQQPPPQSATQPPVPAAGPGAPSQPPHKKSQAPKPNYRELIKEVYAMRKQTTEQELNMQIIKKTLNVADTQNVLSRAPGPGPPPMLVTAPAPIQNEKLCYDPPCVAPSSLASPPQQLPLGLPQPPPTVRISSLKQDDKPSSSSQASSYSPLDLSMRTVKTKADSTEYKYQRSAGGVITGSSGSGSRSTGTPNNLPSSSSGNGVGPSSSSTLPRVDFMPNFSLHAVAAESSPLSRNIRPPVPYSSTPPPPPPLVQRQQQQTNHQPLPQQLNLQHQSPRVALHSPVPSTTHHHHSPAPVFVEHAAEQQQRSYPTPPMPQAQYHHHAESSASSSTVVTVPAAVIKSNSKVSPAHSVLHADSEHPSQLRPSVLETNPFATVKTNLGTAKIAQCNRIVCEQLPPDTSIMPLPKKDSTNNNSPGPMPMPLSHPIPPATATFVPTVGASAVVAPAAAVDPPPQTQPPQKSAYHLACEQNPNFLGRKRHLQAASQYAKKMRYQEAIDAAAAQAATEMANPMPPAPTIQQNNCSSKVEPQMRPVDISVIAVNERALEQERERERGVHITEKVQFPPSHIDLNLAPAKVICKQEPVTPTAEQPPIQLQGAQHQNLSTNQQPPQTLPTIKIESSGTTAPMPTITTTTPVHASAARIRTKAELKGFTFSAPLIETKVAPQLTVPVPTKPEPVANVVTLPPPPPPAAKPLSDMPIMPMPELVKIKEEPCDLPSIPGLAENYNERSLLDFGWNNTCSSFVEQLKTNPSPVLKNRLKKQPKYAEPIQPSLHDDDEFSEDDLPAAAIPNKQQGGSLLKQDAQLLDSSTTRKRDHDGILVVTQQQQQQPQMLVSFSQDTTQTQLGLPQKKLSKLERGKKRLIQERRIANRLRNEGGNSSSESDNELDKRKTERLKKPLRKSKLRREHEKSKFSDCGSDSSSNSKSDDAGANSDKDRLSDTKAKAKVTFEAAAQLAAKIKKEKLEEDDENSGAAHVDTKSHVFIKKEPIEPSEESQEIGPTVLLVKAEIHRSAEQINSSTSNSEESPPPSPTLSKQRKLGLNTMTRSKRRKELEMQLANSKVLRNDKIIRNSMTKIKRKYVRKYANASPNQNQGTASQSAKTGTTVKDSYQRESAMITTRLRAKSGGEQRKTQPPQQQLKNKATMTSSSPTFIAKTAATNPTTATTAVKSKKSSEPSDIQLEVYRYKRSLKVPPSLISLKDPHNPKLVSNDLEAQVNGDPNRNASNARNKTSNKTNELKSKDKRQTTIATETMPFSIIDLLHSRVTNSGSATAALATHGGQLYHAPHQTITTKPHSHCGNSVQLHSETSQNTESTSLYELPLPTLSDDEASAAVTDGGKKRHFSIFDTKVLQTKTRTESKVQQRRERIREIFVGDDRPASAPPDMSLTTNDGAKMTYEQKYEQFLQQMNVVLEKDKRLTRDRTSTALQLLSVQQQRQQAEQAAAIAQQSAGNKLKIKQENGSGDIDSFKMQSPSAMKAALANNKAGTNVASNFCPNRNRRRPGKYLRRKGSSGFDYIRKKKKPTPAVNNAAHGIHKQDQRHYHNLLHPNHALQPNGPHNNFQSYNHLKRHGHPSQFHPHHHHNHHDDEYILGRKMKTEADVCREVQKWVLNKGVGQSAMHKAARLGYIDVIVYCVERMGLYPDQKDNAGYTPLHEACSNGWLEIARVLLQYGANHSEAAHSGIRPLHEASENDHEEIVRLLLSYGADPLLATYSGQTPLMLASSTTMRDILTDYLSDVQGMSSDRRKPWYFEGPWRIYDPSECGFDVFAGAPNFTCDTSRALRSGSMLVPTTTITRAGAKERATIAANLAAPAVAVDPVILRLNKKQFVANNNINNNNNNNSSNNNNNNTSSRSCNNNTATTRISDNNTHANHADHEQSDRNHQQLQQKPEIIEGSSTTTTTKKKTVMDKCAVVKVVDDHQQIDRISDKNRISMKTTIRLNNDNNNSSKKDNDEHNNVGSNKAATKKATSVGNNSNNNNSNNGNSKGNNNNSNNNSNNKDLKKSLASATPAVDKQPLADNTAVSDDAAETTDADGELFEFEESDVLLPPLYLLKGEGNEKWVLLSDLCALLKVKSKETLLNKIYPASSSMAAANKSLCRELKMSDFLEKATCLQLLCAGEKINIGSSKVVLIKYNESVRKLLGVKTVLMKF